METFGANVSEYHQLISMSCGWQVSELATVSFGVLQLDWREEFFALVGILLCCNSFVGKIEEVR